MSPVASAKATPDWLAGTGTLATGVPPSDGSPGCGWTLPLFPNCSRRSSLICASNSLLTHVSAMQTFRPDRYRLHTDPADWYHDC